MPTYDYECQKCQQTFEYSQSMKAAVLTTCPKDKCKAADGVWGEGPVKRLMGTGAGFIFKGSGFYITDYRSENYKSKAKSENAGGTTAAPSSGSTPASPTPSSTPSSSSSGSSSSSSTT